MNFRIAVVVAYGLLVGAWAYLDHRQIDISTNAYDLSHGLPGTLVFLLLTVLTGVVVGRLWALLALLGPLVSLGYLQASGYTSPWHDGAAPLVSIQSTALFVWISLLLLIGVSLSRAIDARSKQ